MCDKIILVYKGDPTFKMEKKGSQSASYTPDFMVDICVKFCHDKHMNF